MQYLPVLAATAAFTLRAAAQAHGEEYAQTMGPLALMFPPDRPWLDETDNTAPCGTNAGVTNRTDFPLTGGFVALVAQADSWDVALRISYSKNPTSSSDFDEFYHGNLSAEVDIGHTCFYVPNQPSNIDVGDVATLQLEYMAIDGSENISHFACSDIKFVDESVFRKETDSLACFNATGNDDDDEEDTSSVEVDTSPVAAATTSTATSDDGAAMLGMSGPLLAAAGLAAAVLM